MARRKKINATAVCLLLIGLGGCSSFKDANPKNFTNALNAYYSHHDECLFPDALKFPYEGSVSDKSIYGAKAMDALTASDMMKKQDGKLIGVNRYTLTPAGERAGGHFCYGHREVTTVDSFTPPADVDGNHVSSVTYHYVVRDVPVWAKTDQMRSAFPELAKSTASDAQDTTKLELTMNGWVKAD